MKARVDFHSHILPGVDDGSRSVEESVRMLRMEAEQGIRHVIATPHFYASHDTPERFLRRRAASWEKLCAAIADQPDLPAVTLGAEVYYFPGISNSEVVRQSAIGQKPYMMLEMPSAPWNQSMYREIEAIYTNQGVMPILAHIDRYIRPFRSREILERLEDLPVLIQANGEFFLRHSTASMAMRLLKENRIHLLGSDCHNLEERKPNLAAAWQKIEKRLGETALEQIGNHEDRVLFGD